MSDRIVDWPRGGRNPGPAEHLDDAHETAAQLIAARPTFTVKYWLRTQFSVDLNSSLPTWPRLARGGRAGTMSNPAFRAGP